MKTILSLLCLSILIYASIEIYYYARFKHLSFEMQRLQRECALVKKQLQDNTPKDHTAVYTFATQHLGLVKINSHQIKKL